MIVMDEENFYTELYNILDDSGIYYEDDAENRDTAIKIIIELKRRKAKKYNKVIVDDEDILNKYITFGMDGIKKMFNRNDCYLYHSDFVFSILFYHYKEAGLDIENLIKWKLINDYE